MERIEKITQVLKNKSINSAFILKPLNIFYFTGELVNGVLYVSQDDAILFVRRPKERPLSTRTKTVFVDSFKEIKGYISASTGRAGFELDSIPYNLVAKLSEALDIREFEDISHEIRILRMVKEPIEIEKIRKAGEIIGKTFSQVQEVFVEGMTERELLLELDYYSRKNGNLAIYRMHSFGNEASFSHILQGEDALVSSYLDAPTGGPGVSSAFPQGSSNKRIEKGKPFTIDIMVNFDGYVADATRTFALGCFPEDSKVLWEKLNSVFRFLCEGLLPGRIPEEIYIKTLEYVSSLGVIDLFMGRGKDRVKFIGHGTGLEVDEYPFIAKGFKIPLSENMIVAIEPKFVGEPFGIMGLEDTFVMNNDGPESLIPFESSLILL